MQEQQHQIKIYGFLQKAVYAVVALDCASLFYLDADIPIVSNLLKNFSKMSFFYPPINAKFATLILIGLVAVGTKAKKKPVIQNQNARLPQTSSSLKPNAFGNQ